MTRSLLCLVALLLVPSALSAQFEAGFFVSESSPDSVVILGPNGQPIRQPGPPATGRSSVRGRVVSAEGGQPIRRATVRISAAELRGTRTTLSDSDGRFEFRDLPAGRYSISASKLGLITWFYGQTRPGAAGRPVLLADNQAADAVNIAVPRASVITGRITDEFGDPLPNVAVSLLRANFMQGERRLLPAGAAASTNDIGEYRLFGLAPGQYYVSAAVNDRMLQSVAGRMAVLAGSSALEGEEARNGYAPTFFPGTTDVNLARRLSVGVAELLTEINITLVPTRMATITGAALDAQGNPARGFVQVTTRGGITSMRTLGAPLRADGQFSIPNVPPGEYVLIATIPPASISPGVRPDVAVASVTVNGEDVSGVQMSPIAPVAVTGHIAFDDADAPPVSPSAITVVPQFLDDPLGAGLGRIGAVPRPVQDDFTFELQAVPGRIALRPVAQGLEVRAVRVNGRDVTDTGLEVGPDGLSGIEIELTRRRQELSGSVADANGTELADYNVLVFAQDRNRWTAPFNRYLALGRPAADGRFKVSLPSGDYYAIALDQVDMMEWQDPEFLERLVRDASTVSLADGESQTLDLKLFTAR